jgi:catalase
VIVPGGKASAAAVAGSGLALSFIAECSRHCKTVGAIGEGAQVLEKALPSLPAKTDSGVVVAAGPNGFMEAFLKAMAGHRHFGRVIEGVSA